MANDFIDRAIEGISNCNIFPYNTETEIDELIQENMYFHERLDRISHENKSLAADLRKSRDDCDRLEQAIEENREIYLLAIEAAKLGIYDTDAKDEDFKVKGNWLSRLGYNPALANDADITWESLIHPEDHDRVMSAFQKEIDGEVDSLAIEYRLRAADGQYRWILESSKVIGKRRNRKTRIVGTHYDITERKLAEEKEREQRAFTDAISESAAVFNSTLELDKVINLILVNVSKVIPNDESDVWLLDKSQKNVHPASRRDMYGRILASSSVIIPLEEIGIFKQISETRMPVYLPKMPQNSCPIPSRNPNCQSLICTPICFGEYLLGYLVLNSLQKNFYTQMQIQRLQIFANQAAIAVRNAQLYSQAKEAAALEERQRLARDMHDVISQTLFSATIKSEALPYLMDSEPPEVVKEDLNELHRLTRGALAEMRTMLMELRPNTIVNTDLGNLLNQMVEGLAGRTTARVDLSTEGVGLLPPDVQTAIFRITQETINNILKHSKADHVQIRFVNKKDGIYLCIEDNGCGFDPACVAVERMGLRIMRERAESINADFELTSQIRKGTKIQLNWKKPQNATIN